VRIVNEPDSHLFQEGLAVLISDGGGAENVSSEAAFETIRQGRHFIPELSLSWLLPKNASSCGLETHMYYRQTARFAGCLRDENPAAFTGMIKSITSRTPFAEAVELEYGKTLEEMWNTFIIRVKQGAWGKES
jgi:hypothetical protein